MLSEKNISGRPISIFKLDNPIVYENRVINVLELSSPKD
jgi:predicted metalloenzyme YecM